VASPCVCASHQSFSGFCPSLPFLQNRAGYLICLRSVILCPTLGLETRILTLPSKLWRENGNRYKKNRIISGQDYLNALICNNHDFFTLNSARLTVSSVPFSASIILLLYHMEIRGKYEYFHDSTKTSSVVLCGCAALCTRRTKLECFRKQDAISTSNGVRKDWK